MKPIFLYGPSYSGKSAAGKCLAEALNLPFFDLDVEIENRAGMAVDAIFATQGEAHFRRLEREALQALIASTAEAVIALGGGALLDDAGRAAVQAAGRVICLRASADTLLDRAQASDVVRPLLADDPAKALQAYLSRRAAHYDSFEHQLNTDAITPGETAWRIQKTFGVYRLKAMGSPYDVRVQAGGLQVIDRYLSQRGLAGPFCVVADSNTEAYGRQAVDALSSAGEKAALVVIPAGETHKTVETVGRLWQAFLANGLERGSTVVAVGGGVVGDLAGFAAATYLRGIRWVCVPTTLLAMVDASIGGKTGADLPQGKNLVGAFHAPALVLADPDVLATLPGRELRAGMAEVVKAGVIADSALFARCAAIEIPADLPGLIPAAMAIKIGVIESDPFERGERALLNFGHTIGHAVEHASGFALLHGEAIAIGMVAETRLAEQLGIAEAGTTAALVDVLLHLSLPVEIPAGLDADVLLRTMRVDKKMTAGALRFALPHTIGAAGLIRLEEAVYRATLSS